MVRSYADKYVGKVRSSAYKSDLPIDTEKPA